MNFIMISHFLPQMIKIEKVEKLVANLHDKTECVALILENVHRIIKFDQDVWLKPYIDMNTGLRKKARIILKTFLMMNNAVFGKSMENVRKHRDIKVVTTERRRNYLVSGPNFHTTNFFTEHLLAI